MDEASEREALLNSASTLPDVLGAAYDAFEAIRLLAHASQDQDPGMFAAFIATASAAVDGPPDLSSATHGSPER